MGFGWEIGEAGAAIALLVTAAVGTAEPAEPLTVTRLADSESKLLISTASGDIGNPVTGADDFSRAVSDAVRNQQQSIAAQCQSANRATGPIAARWAWEASCRYRRY
jgi:hypothetical protein